jgi:CRISPR-associated protein (TIGR03984 family)
MVEADGRLMTSHEAGRGNAEAEAACPALRAATLQQARLFAPHAEMLLWRDGDNAWHARLIRDLPSDESTAAAAWHDAFDEPQLLWGTHGRHLPGGFTLLADGAQGLRHAVPMALPLGLGGAATPPRLVVRHYLNTDGFARVVASRLVGLLTVG